MKLPAVAKRASWNLIDQMISSLTNAVLSFMVARAVDPVTFGGFAVAFTVFTLVIGGARALCTAPLNIRFSDADPAEQTRAASAATGLSLVISLVVGLTAAVAGSVLGGSTGEALLVMGLVLPAVIVQDSYRYVFFSRQTPAKAAVNDGAWAVLQIGAVAALLFADVSSVGPYVLVWGLAGGAAVLLAFRQSATLPSVAHAMGWLREQNNLTRYTFASWATQQGTMQGALLVIAAIGTVVANGALRGAQILLGPAAIIASSALTFAIPEFARRRRTLTDRQWLLSAAGVSAVVAFLALCWGSIFLLMPDAVGAALLVETWPATRELLPAAVVGQVLGCLTVGPVVMLYAIDRAKATFRIHLVLGTMVFLGGVGGVILAGGPGAQWGFAIANGVVLPFWFARLWRELRARAAAPEVEAVDGELVAVVDPDATAVFTAIRRPHYFEDLESAQMATMVLPRIAAGPRPVPPPGPMRRPFPPGPYHPGNRRPGFEHPGHRPPPPPGRSAPGHPLNVGVGRDQPTRPQTVPPPPPPARAIRSFPSGLGPPAVLSTPVLSTPTPAIPAPDPPSAWFDAAAHRGPGADASPPRTPDLPAASDAVTPRPRPTPRPRTAQPAAAAHGDGQPDDAQPETAQPETAQPERPDPPDADAATRSRPAAPRDEAAVAGPPDPTGPDPTDPPTPHSETPNGGTRSPTHVVPAVAEHHST